MSLKDDLAAIDRALADARPRARRPKRPKETRRPHALAPPLPDESAEVLDMLREVPLEDNPAPRGNKKLRASKRAIAEVQKVLCAGIPLTIPTPRGDRRFACGDLTDEARAEDGWLRTTHLMPSGEGHVYIGPAAFGELHRRAKFYLDDPDRMQARIDELAAASRAFRDR